MTFDRPRRSLAVDDGASAARLAITEYVNFGRFDDSKIHRLLVRSKELIQSLIEIGFGVVLGVFSTGTTGLAGSIS